MLFVLVADLEFTSHIVSTDTVQVSLGDKRERLDEVAAAGVILKRSRLDETGLDGGDDDAAGVVGVVAVFGTVCAVEGTGYSEGDLSGSVRLRDS